MRLPTEAEWEHAARGGDASAGHESLDVVAWYKDNSGGTTHEVGQKQKNGYGLYDMLGNVWEWTQDWYDARYYDLSSPHGNWIDPEGPAMGQLRSQRGGSWYFGPLHARASSRGRGVPESRYNYGIGVRCAGEKVPVGAAETTSE